MADEVLGKVRDPQFPDYVYAARPLIDVFRDRDGRKSIGNLFLGEWMKVLDERVSPKRLMRVKYRGGEGYVAPTDVSRDRFLEIFFIDVSQGDAILIQTPDDRRILIDGGDTEDAWSFIRNKYRLDKPDNYIDLDAVVATHSDSDHAGGLINILTDRKIAVKRFYHNGLFRRTDSAGDPGPHVGGRVSGLEDRPGKGAAPALTPLMQKLLDAVDQAEQNLPVVVGRMADSGRRVDTPAGGFVCRRLDAADRYLPPYDDSAKLLTIEVLCWPPASGGCRGRSRPGSTPGRRGSTSVPSRASSTCAATGRSSASGRCTAPGPAISGMCGRRPGSDPTTEPPADRLAGGILQTG